MDIKPIAKPSVLKTQAKGQRANYCPSLSRGAKVAIGAGGGALAGAGIGFLAGGPVGAAVGAGIGALVGGIAGWLL